MIRIVSLCIIFLLCLSSQAQSEQLKADYSLAQISRSASPDPVSDQGFDPSRLVFGGNFWAQFGNNTFVDISPLVGYRITDRLTAGAGLTYIYSKRQYLLPTGGTFTQKNSWYGGRLYARYTVFNNVFIHGEYEILNFEYFDNLTLETDRIWFGSPIVGAGYLMPTGSRGAFMISALYVLNADNPRSPYYYSSPFQFRVGFVLR